MVSVSPTLSARKPTECSESLLLTPLELERDPPPLHTNDMCVWYLVYLWAFLWIAVTTIQIYIYVQIWHIISDIREVKQDWNHLKHLICDIVSVPSLCPIKQTGPGPGHRQR